ncbi:hypothetical protein AAG570_010436 [Ranatra chinensis]|uniref:Peptidase C2 calpain domain-containing protein n=1 Tax=Ranatra chinensis TaxID=642074 RepID=A0ABD0YMI8_9HEMI
MAEVNGEWLLGETAGGSRNDLELFAINPQYLLSVGPPHSHPTKQDYLFPREKKKNAVEVSVCLTQLGDPPLLHIAFLIYETDTKDERLSAEYFLCVQPEESSGAFINWRQVRHRFRLSPGLYIIVPATFKPHTNGNFNLTVHAPPPISLQPLISRYGINIYDGIYEN